jgi:hypothetical protein
MPRAEATAAPAARDLGMEFTTGDDTGPLLMNGVPVVVHGMV